MNPGGQSTRFIWNNIVVPKVNCFEWRVAFGDRSHMVCGYAYFKKLLYHTSANFIVMELSILCFEC
ncbi:hypothetical protein HanPI659440_Chr16g0622431 [Helianthus annuus]|nr:hypothetical protein HanPI659440_Chr16g0622431 [Helianthus annuus]